MRDSVSAHGNVRHDAAYGGPQALHGARSPTGATAPKSPPRPRYAGGMPVIDSCPDCPVSIEVTAAS